MRTIPTLRIVALMALLFLGPVLKAQTSIARAWSDQLLLSMQEDLARPHVQARTLFHFSTALYDAWAAYDKEAKPYLLGKTSDGCLCPFKGVPPPADVEAARREAMSFAAFRLLSVRVAPSPQSMGAVYRYRELMKAQGYDFRNFSTDYASGSPAALGNYIAQCILQSTAQDGANEHLNYADTAYHPVNPPLEVMAPESARQPIDPNHWQPLKLDRVIDQDGYPMLECRCGAPRLATMIDSVDKTGRRIKNIQTFQGSHWGRVKPFALSKQHLKVYRRNGRDHWLYHDPGNRFFPHLDTIQGKSVSEDYQWNFALVAAWSALLNPADTTRWDISPGAMGNVRAYPRSLEELRAFYQIETGRDPGTGHSLNPISGKAYQPVWAPRGDFIRTAIQYWAEGPNAETPPGHWLSLLHYINDQPGLVRKFNGKGSLMDTLEWDVKSLFILGGALHDAAVAAWSAKNWYDGIRPISALRRMAVLGQSTHPNQPSYHPAGIPLIPGRIELVKKGDPLAGPKNKHLGKIKLYAWKGPLAVSNPDSATAGVGWILAENWFPYQPKTFVTPPHAGFVSEHAAFSHAAAEAFTLLTGSAWFPGGMGVFAVQANQKFLRIEQGPGVPIQLQWATYRDAADQAGLSRIWCGANAPFDDIPGRLMGIEVGNSAFQLAKSYFYKDRDRYGFFSFEDCDDNNAAVHPGAVEKCDGIDNDCNGQTDDVTPPCGGG